jgi:hypothetical protein
MPDPKRRAVLTHTEEKYSTGQGFGRIAEKQKGTRLSNTMNVDDLPESDPRSILMMNKASPSIW